jgi:uncharacterized protein YndB with AHSA1/START domain
VNSSMGVMRRDASGGGVRFERRFDVSPSELWPFLVEAEHLSQWITPDVQIDARVGGRMVFRWPSGPAMEGEITVFDPPQRLEYIWREGEVHSLVRLELRAEGGNTLLLVDHSGLPLKDAGGFAAGWHSHLDWLDLVVIGRGERHNQQARFNELAAQYGWEAPAST